MALRFKHEAYYVISAEKINKLLLRKIIFEIVIGLLISVTGRPNWIT